MLDSETPIDRRAVVAWTDEYAVGNRGALYYTACHGRCQGWLARSRDPRATPMLVTGCGHRNRRGVGALGVVRPWCGSVVPRAGRSGPAAATPPGSASMSPAATTPASSTPGVDRRGTWKGRSTRLSRCAFDALTTPCSVVVDRAAPDGGLALTPVRPPRVHHNLAEAVVLPARSSVQARHAGRRDPPSAPRAGAPTSASARWRRLLD